MPFAFRNFTQRRANVLPTKSKASSAPALHNRANSGAHNTSDFVTVETLLKSCWNTCDILRAPPRRRNTRGLRRGHARASHCPSYLSHTNVFILIQSVRSDLSSRKELSCKSTRQSSRQCSLHIAQAACDRIGCKSGSSRRSPMASHKSVALCLTMADYGQHSYGQRSVNDVPEAQFSR